LSTDNTSNKVIADVYNTICNNSINYGNFHKCLFHLHTPASFDYAVLEKYRNPDGGKPKKTYKDFSQQELYDLCIENNLFPNEMDINLIKEIFSTNKDIFLSENEMLTYLLIAWKLFAHNMELVLITDHHTIIGYDKLNHAIDMIQKTRNKEGMYQCPVLILGIEISCADKNHVVGIFEDNELVRKKIQNFLDEFLMSEEDGVYLTSMDVIKQISDIKGIPYIAHINTSTMFSPGTGKFLSGGYKKRLFNLPEFYIVGLRDKEQYSRNERIIREYTKKEFCYVIDLDSHSIDTIKDKYFWLKGQKCNFNMIREAVRDCNISIEYEEPRPPICYIKGVLAKNKGKAFLAGSTDNPLKDFSLSFSESLNCFIGGRGTGKSTVLNMIEAVLQQRFADQEVFEAICEYDEIWLLYSKAGEEYLISFIPMAKKYENDSAFRNLQELLHGYSKLNRSISKGFNQKEIAETVLNKCINIYKIVSVNREKVTCEIIEKSRYIQLLNQFFSRSYSVNDLVQKASDKKINQYIINVMSFNKNLLEDKFLKITSKNGLKKFLIDLNNILGVRKKTVQAELMKFNNADSQKDKLRIIYNQKKDIPFFIDFKMILDNSRAVIRLREGHYWRRHNLTLDGVIAYLYKCCEIFTMPKFLLMLLDDQIDKIQEKISIKSFCEDFSNWMVDRNFEKVSDENSIKIIMDIKKDIFYYGERDIIQKFRREFIDQIEDFDIQFNVKNREGINQRTPQFRNIRQLSLGQKVVAMLSFVLGYSDYSNDYRPLVIDQPEDNLDNQYIYKNLVDELRNIKTRRQVIIATHNATIVTNAKADQVIVMQSDGEHGWIEGQGYPNQNAIKRHIINYLEGGVESFKHKCFVYEEIIKNKA